MSSAKIAAACALVAVSLSGCGVASKPEAGSAQAATAAKHSLADPRTRHIRCLTEDHIPYTEETLHPASAGPSGYPSIQIGKAPSGPLAEFTKTPGAAQNVQMEGKSQGALVIGAALVYPNQASDALMDRVDKCMTLGVSG
ncbi:MAG TPA: hypothetical protein VMF14_20935 [Solirubrobacteraceae bacterium]|nr:hypothetical protein [Solirubrobacteraceae bacterium]